jgi:predicted MFS family arabinose efflux permease
MERLRDAWRYARSVPELGYLLVVQGAALIFFTSVEPIEVLYAKSTLNVGDAGYGAIAGAWGVGMVIGSLLFSRWIRRPLGPQLLGGTLTIGLAYLGFAAAPTLGVACLVAIAGGAGNGLQWVAAISAMQRLTPDRLYARLMGAVESIGSISPAIGFSLGGLLTAVSDPRVAFLVAGSGAIVMTFAFVRIVRRGVGGTTSGRTPTDGAHIPSVAPPAGARVSAGKAPG